MTCIRKFDELGAAGGLAPTGDAPAQAADRRAAVRTLPGPMGAGPPGGRGRRRPVGDLVTVIGAGHTAIGLVGHRAALAGIARDGVIDAVRGRRDREEALWFLVSGAALLVTGRLAAWTERRTGTLPTSTGALLLGIGAVGAAVLPQSGVWSLLPAGVAALRAARRPVTSV